MIKKETAQTYHTYKDFSVENEKLPDLDFAEVDGDIAFTWDINKGCSEHFRKADAIYSEPCWRYGYELFAKRDKKKQVCSYKEYLQHQAQIIRELRIPALVLCGAAMVSALAPDYACDIYMEQHKCMGKMAFYNVSPALFSECKSNQDICKKVAELYHTVLDFNSGYGNIIPFVRENGGNFICSDLCGYAIRYIYNKYMQK